MAQHDRLISFLEREAEALRSRIAGLKQRDIPAGVDTGEGDDTRIHEMREASETKLAEIEVHLAELRLANTIPPG